MADAPGGGFRTTIAALLRRGSLFASLADHQLKSLARHSEQREAQPGERLIRAGAPQERVVYVVEGKVALYRRYRPAEVTLLLGLLEGPCLFGDAECAGGVPWMVSARAESSCTLVYIANDAFMRCVQEHAAIAYALYRDASIRHLMAHATAQTMAFHTVETRLLRLLIDYGRNFGRQEGEDLLIERRITHVELAAALGVSRKTIERAVRPLESRGVLVRDGNEVLRIPNVKAVTAELPEDLLSLSSSLKSTSPLLAEWDDSD